MLTVDKEKQHVTRMSWNTGKVWVKAKSHQVTFSVHLPQTMHWNVWLMSKILACKCPEAMKMQGPEIEVKYRNRRQGIAWKQTWKSKTQQRPFCAHLPLTILWIDWLMNKKTGMQVKDSKAKLKCSNKPEKAKSGRDCFLLIYLKPCAGMIGWWAKYWHAEA
jgi:hypothetical protein